MISVTLKANDWSFRLIENCSTATTHRSGNRRSTASRERSCLAAACACEALLVVGDGVHAQVAALTEAATAQAFKGGGGNCVF